MHAAVEWVQAALKVLRAAPDAHWNNDEEAAGELLAQIKAKRLRGGVAVCAAARLFHFTAGGIMYPDFLKYFPLVKVQDDADGRAIAYGLATCEAVDLEGERCVYKDTLPAYQAWSDAAMRSTAAASQELSMGNYRLQHSLQIAGKCIGIDYLDDKKEIWTKGKAVDEDISQMLREGFLRGQSHGGKYAYRKCAECGADIPQKNFCPMCNKKVVVNYAVGSLSEISWVDAPCLPQATFAYVKADGSMELRKFQKAEAKTKRVDGEDLPASAFLIVLDKDDTSTWNLPWRFSTEEKTVAHLRNALARFNQLKDVPEDVKAKAWKRLVGLCKKHGIEVSDDEKKAAGASHDGSMTCPKCGADIKCDAAKCPECGCGLPGEHELPKNAEGQNCPTCNVPLDENGKCPTCGAEVPLGGGDKAAAKGTPREPRGRFTARGTGEIHDCLTAAGFEHTRTGTTAQAGSPALPEGTFCYSHKDGKAKVTVQPDGSWEHEDGKGRRTKGSGKDALAEHLASCKDKKKKDADKACAPLLNAVRKLKGVHHPMLTILKKDLTANDSFDALQQRAHRALQAKFGDGWNINSIGCYIQAMFDNELVYTLGSQQYAIGYKDDGENCTLIGEPVHVVVTYVPAEAKAATAITLRKDMSHVSIMSQILQSSAQLRRWVMSEAQVEDGDPRDVAIAARMKDWIDEGSAILSDIVEDETDELTDDANLSPGPLMMAANAINEPGTVVGDLNPAIAALNAF